jgi:uncharacterized protein
MQITWSEIFTAVALLLVIEGTLPFLSPKHWRKTMSNLLNQNDHVIRIMALISMLIGTVIMYMVRAGIFGK